MNKIVRAVNSMIANSNLITNVVKGKDGFFFTYKSTYKWSIARENGEHILSYFPGDDPLYKLASINHSESPEAFAVVSYRDSEIGTKEAKASFAELYMILKEKVYNIDDVLDEIITDNNPL